MAYHNKWVVPLALFCSMLMQVPLYANPAEEQNFEQLYGQLKKGRQYDDSAQKGFIKEQRVNEQGQVFKYALSVPDNYDPQKPLPLHVILHGWVGRPMNLTNRWWKNMSRFAMPNSITLYPQSTRKSKWWTSAQVENIAALVNTVKEQYNIDENRVYLQGASDGGTSVYYLASRNNTQWAGLLSYIGSAIVLINPKTEKTGVEGNTNFGNLLNKPLFVLNSGMDRLYPSGSVAPFIEKLQGFNADLQYHDLPADGHNLKWYGRKKSVIKKFIKDRVRQPYPDSILWQVNAEMRYPRSHWLVLNQLEDSAKGGIMDIKKLGNRVYANVDNVKQFTLLISPEHFDMNEDIRVIINKQYVFKGKVDRNVEVLQHWADIDQDRTQLYGGKVVIDL